MRSPARIAFVTPEFPSAQQSSGGLASYLGRVTSELIDRGFAVDVFTVIRGGEPDIQQRDRLRIHYVTVPSRPLRSWPDMPVWRLSREAKALAAAVQREERDAPYRFIQCTDYGLTGLFIELRSDRRLLVRSSSITEQMRKIEGVGISLGHLLWSRAERKCLRRADVAYAPSRFAADYFRSRHNIPLTVLRPPFFMETEPDTSLPNILPPRYFVHFGNLNRVKGTDVLAAALRIACRTEPELKLVLAGSLATADPPEKVFPEFRDRADGVIWLGPLEKRILYRVVQNAIGTIAPSRCDNLPNSVLESLALGTPVIGSDGASIDEIVAPDCGWLTPIGDAALLAEAMIRAWRREAPFDGRPFELPPVYEDMQPQVAISNLLQLAGVGDTDASS